MFRAFAPLLAIALFAFANDGEPEWNSIADRAFGRTYTSAVDFDTISHTPKWEDDAENPPISPRKALRLASEMRDSVANAPDGWEWEPINLSLTRGAGDRWYWTVLFRAKPTTDKRNLKIHAIRILVYMDGTVTKPSVSHNEPNKISGLD